MAYKKNLLISEPPLQVLPSLAVAIGLNEAIVIQQIHYWTINTQTKGEVDPSGNKWIYNTYEEWREGNFPFWSVPTIQRIFLNLESLGLVISAQLNANKRDMRKYYRIDYEALDDINLMPSEHINLMRSKTSNRVDVNRTETTSETTTEKEEEVNPLFALFMNNVSMVTPLIADAIEKAEKDYSPEWVSEAIQIAGTNGAKSWNYCESILQRWKRDGKADRKNGKKQTVAQSGDRTKYVKGEYADYIEH